MAYVKQIWEDGVTPCDDEHMNHIEDGIYDTLSEIINIMCPVGTYYETSDLNFDPNVMWGGTWELENDGTVLVSKSSVSGSKFNVNLGTVVGEETHTLTVAEMPSHKHSISYIKSNITPLTDAGVSGYNGNNQGIGSTSVDSTGGGKAHNIIQPSKIVNRWHRTA